MSQIESLQAEIARLSAVVAGLARQEGVVGVGDKEKVKSKESVDEGVDVVVSEGGDDCVIGVNEDPKELDSRKMSWSDEMDSCESGFVSDSPSSVEMPVRPVELSVSDAVKQLSFVAEVDGKSQGGFFSDYVRTPANKSFLAWLKERGVLVPKAPTQDLALALYAQATVPDVFAGGRLRLKSMAKLGDSLLTAMLTEQLFIEKFDSAYIQGRVGALLSRPALSKCACCAGFSRHVVMPSGVNAQTSSVCGEAVEAVAGALYLCGGLKAVRSFMKSMQLLS